MHQHGGRWMAVALLWAIPATCWARWPEGVLNYCGFDGVWDEAGWRDLGWAQGGTQGIGFDRQTKRFGKASLRIEGAAEQSRAALNLGGIPVQPGRPYVLRAWVKTQDIAGEAVLALQPHEENKPLPFLDLGPGARLRGSRDWALLEVRVPAMAANVVRVHPYLWVKGPGTAWFDEAAFTETGVQVPLGGQRPITDADYSGVRWDDAALPPNLLHNPGFEQGLDRWYVESGKPQIDDHDAAAGARSMRLDGFAECGYTVVQVRVRIDPRRAYRLSLRLKTALQAGLSCVQLLGLKADGQVMGYFGQDHTSEFCYGRGVQGWHEVSVVLREFEPQTDALNLYLQLHDALGTAWFDEVRLAPLSLEETKKVRGG